MKKYVRPTFQPKAFVPEATKNPLIVLLTNYLQGRVKQSPPEPTFHPYVNFTPPKKMLPTARLDLMQCSLLLLGKGNSCHISAGWTWQTLQNVSQFSLSHVCSEWEPTNRFWCDWSQSNPDDSLANVQVFFCLGHFLRVVFFYHEGEHQSRWWLNQPIWKICSSNWIISTIFGVKMQNIWNHHLVSCSCPDRDPYNGLW